MAGEPQHSLLPHDAAPPAAAFDVVYVPEETLFVQQARARGLRTVTGTAMFVAQAAATFERWFGFAPKPVSGRILIARRSRVDSVSAGD